MKKFKIFKPDSKLSKESMKKVKGGEDSSTGNTNYNTSRRDHSHDGN